MKLFTKIIDFIKANGFTSFAHLATGAGLWYFGWFDAFAFLLGWFVCRNWNIIWDTLGLGSWLKKGWNSF